MAAGAARAKPGSMWPATTGCVLVGAATVTVLLGPLPPAPREWIVRGLLALWVVGVVGAAIVGGRVERTASNRTERVVFQTVSFWAFITAAFFVFSNDEMARESTAVIFGVVTALLFGTSIWVHDAWLSPPPEP